MGAAPLQILIADDEPLFRLAVADALRARDPSCVVSEVGDGMEAEIALLGGPFDCVITDLQMPLVDGYGLLDVMRDRGIQVPIVVVSAHGTESTKTRVAELGAARYFDKPVDLKALVDATLDLAAMPASATGADGVLAGLLLRVLEQERRSGSIAPPAAAGGWGDSTDRSTVDRAANVSSETKDPHRSKQSPPPLSLTRVAQVLSPTARGNLPAALPDGSSPTQQFERNTLMNIEQSLQSAMEISGCIGAILVDFESGMSLGSKGTGTLNLDTAAAGNTEVIRAKMRTMAALGLDDKIEDVLITLSTQYHILRPLRRMPNLFLYLALDRSKANLALARLKCSTIEQELRILRLAEHARSVAGAWGLPRARLSCSRGGRAALRRRAKPSRIRPRSRANAASRRRWYNFTCPCSLPRPLAPGRRLRSACGR